MSKEVPDEHVLGSRAVLIFQQRLPAHWIWRPETERDYGVDGTVEITEIDPATSKRLATAKRLFAQIKGQGAVTEDERTVSFVAKVKDLLYLANHDLPACLVLVDVESARVFWLDVHAYVRDVLNRKNPNWREQESVTVYFGKEHQSAETILEQWPKIAKDGPLEISIARTGIPDWNLVRRVRGLDDADIARKQREYAAAAGLKGNVDFEQALEHLRNGDADSAYQKMLEAARQAEESGEPELGLRTLKAILLSENPIDENRTQEIFALADRVIKLARQLNRPEEEAHARGVLLQAVAHRVLSRWSDTRLLLKLATEHKDTENQAVLTFVLAEDVRNLTKIQSDFQALMVQCLEKNYVLPLLDLLKRLSVLELHVFRLAKLFDGAQAAEPIRKGALQHMELAEKLARATKNDELIIDVLADRAFVERGTVSMEKSLQTLAEAETVAKQLGYAGPIQRIARLKELLQRMKAPEEETPPKSWDDLSPEDQDAFVREFVSRVAGDIDADDDISRAIRTGLEDRDPGRFLRWCEHLDVETIGRSMLGRMVSLPIGLKVLYCRKFNIPEVGPRLAPLFEKFQDGHCVKCAFREPRPKDWRWTPEWHTSRGHTPQMETFLRNFRNSFGRGRSE